MAKMTTFLGAALAVALMAAPVLAEDAPNRDTVVAEVNGTPITLGHMIAMRETLPPQYQALEDQVLFDGILDQLIQQAALEQSVAGKLTARDTLALENERRGFMAGVALREVVKAAVTEPALQAAYDLRYKSAEPKTEYHAAHILVETEADAQQIKALLDKGGEFAKLAMENSSDGSASNGGDLGWFGQGMMVKPFEEAVMAMKPGTISAPIKTDFGWHLIKLIETRIAEAPPLDEVRAELAAELEQKAVADHVQAATRAADVKRPGEGLDPALLKDATLLDK